MAKLSGGNVVGADYQVEMVEGTGRFIVYDELESEYINYFDVIILRHVLEHTVEPRIFLNRLSKILKPRGKIIIEVPNYDSHWRKWFGINYNQLSTSVPTFYNESAVNN